MVDPKIFAAFIRDAELENIKLVSVDSALGEELGKGKSYNLSLKTKFPFKKNETCVFIFPTYKVFFEDDEGNNSGIFTFKCEFSLHYRVNNIDKYTDDLVKYFADNNAKFNSWSYFRELLSNVTMRMGIGPLVAPLLKPRPPEKLLRSKR